MAQPSMEQVIAESVQGLGSRSTPRILRAHSTPIEAMEPIAEEKSELAMDIAEAVVEKLDLERKLDDKLKELMFRGDSVFRNIQARQEQSMEALARSVGMCLESQRTFHEEHQRLLSAVKDLAKIVVPLATCNPQAMQAQMRANTVAEDTETLGRQMEEQRSAMAAAMAPFTPMPTQQPQSPVPVMLPPTPTATSPQPAAGTFNITLRKADEVSLGLSVNETEDGNNLVVEGVLAGGAVEAWNRTCFGDATGERVVVAGDIILRVNNIEQDVQKMLEECTKSRLVKLAISRGPAGPHVRVGATMGGSGQTPVEPVSMRPELDEPLVETPEKISLRRRRTPEFVPAGSNPLNQMQQSQFLDAPPGLFLPKPIGTPAASSKDDARDEEGSDKEN